MTRTDELRVIDVPANAAGISQGTWLRWGELRLYLLNRDQRELADEIEAQLLGGETIAAREVTVRRSP